MELEESKSILEHLNNIISCHKITTSNNTEKIFTCAIEEDQFIVNINVCTDIILEYQTTKNSLNFLEEQICKWFQEIIDDRFITAKGYKYFFNYFWYDDIVGLPELIISFER